MRVKILMICFSVCCINRYMTVRIRRVSGVHQNIAFLRLYTLNSLPSGRQGIPCVIASVSARGSLTKILIIITNQINTLISIDAVIIQSCSHFGFDPVDGIICGVSRRSCFRLKRCQNHHHYKCHQCNDSRLKIFFYFLHIPYLIFCTCFKRVKFFIKNILFTSISIQPFSL